MSSLRSGPAAEAAVRHTPLPARQRHPPAGLGHRAQAGAQQKLVAFLGQREVTEGKRAEEREAGKLLLQSNKAEPHVLKLFSFDQLLNLPRAAYEREGRWQDVGERQQPCSATQPGPTRAPCSFKAPSQRPAALPSPCSATP